MIYDLYVVLGCFGLRINEFTCCGGVENVILKVGPQIPDYDDLMTYLDQVRLFDRPMFEFSAVRHLLNNINTRFSEVTKPIWHKRDYDMYQKFVIDHRNCGTFVKLVLPEQYQIEPSAKEEFVMKSATQKLRLIK